MTGSGKTGLAVVLLEEALSAGIPALVLDPKGDMGNLALVFPDLAPASFRPWVNEAEAQAAGLDVDAYAEKVAADWKAGLESAGIGPERLQALRDAADVTVYTPGSTAGEPLNVIGSFNAPRALLGDRGGDAARRDPGHRHQPARPGRDPGGSSREPRARAAREPPRERLAGRT